MGFTLTGAQCTTPDCAVDMYSCTFKFTDTHHGHECQGKTGLSKISLDILIIPHTSVRVKRTEFGDQKEHVIFG